VSDLQALVPPTFDGLADLLASDDRLWDQPSLCEGWLVRHVAAHLTMPARLTPEQFGAELAAAGGDFTALSDTVAARDAALPEVDLLAQLRSPVLHAWQPPGGGPAGALSHAVIHALDVTLPLAVAPVAPPAAVDAVLDLLVASQGTWFGVDPTGDDGSASSVDRVALLAGRALPDGRRLPRR
jgi:uncharacterized protein (TIGR03083 family)